LLVCIYISSGPTVNNMKTLTTQAYTEVSHIHVLTKFSYYIERNKNSVQRKV